jgi:hypothetical protein
MFKVYKGQTALRVTLETFVDLEGVNSVAIKYKKPNKTMGSFSAGVSDAARGKIFHECLEGEIDQAGWWTFWARVEFADGRAAARGKRRSLCGTKADDERKEKKEKKKKEKS